MNILFLLKTLDIGGVEIVTRALTDIFIKKGHHVSIFSFAPSLHSIETSINKSAKIYTQKKLKYSQDNIKALRKVLIEDSINIIINQWGLPFLPILIAKKASLGLNIKIISVHHNVPDDNGKLQNINLKLVQKNNLIKKIFLLGERALFKLITSSSMRYVYNSSTLYMVLSPSFIAKFKKFTGLKNTDHLIAQPNPITISSKDFTYNQDTKKKEIIYVGRLDYNQKRVFRVIETWAELENQFLDWKLIIIGDGEERENLEKLVKNLSLKHVQFEGFQSPDVYYKNASILLLTSEYEGFPLVLTECMSFGVIPIVYGSYSAVYDIIKNKKNGIIIQPEKQGFNKYKMAEQISFLIKDNEKRNEMAQECIRYSNENYSIETIYKSWEKIFNQISL